MWLTQKKKSNAQESFEGKVSISGEKCAVLSGSEHRNARVYSAGGYCWMPETGDDVLVLKNGSTDILGKLCENTELLPGEVCIRSKGGAEIYLKNDGNIYIKGRIITEGE